MKESSITETESLELIQSMINKAKNHVSENGTLYLLWGWVVLVCSLGQFMLKEILHYEQAHLVWMLTWLVIPFMIYFLKRQRKLKVVRTYTDDILGYVWNSFVIMMFLTFFIVFRFIPEGFRFVNIFVLLLYGMPTFLSGTILKFRPLIFGGFSCWILAFISGFTNDAYHPLFIAAAVIIAWIIPGYILKSRFKKTIH